MNSRKILLLVLSVIFLIATATPTLRPASAALYDGSQSAAAAAQLSSERIRAHVEYLASDQLQGRGAGTPAADQLWPQTSDESGLPATVQLRGARRAWPAEYLSSEGRKE